MDSNRHRLFRNEKYFPSITNNKKKKKNLDRTQIDFSEDKKKQIETPLEDYFERLKKTLDSMDDVLTRDNNHNELVKKLQEEEIYSGKSVNDFIDLVKNEKRNQNQNQWFFNELNTHEMREEFDKKKDEQENIGRSIHELGKSIPLNTPTPIFHLMDVHPSIKDKSKKIRDLIEKDDLEPQEQEYVEENWREFGKDCFENIAWFHPFFEGIVLNVTKIEEEYNSIRGSWREKLTPQFNQFPLSLLEYVEYILLHELFHYVVWKRCLEHLSMRDYEEYWAKIQDTFDYPDFGPETTKQYKNHSDRHICQVLPYLQLELTCDLSHNSPPFEYEIPPGYYYPLEEALANLFAYEHHSMVNKTTKPFEWISTRYPQGVGYDDWMKFIRPEISHAVHVELGWMIKGRTFDQGVNAVHDSIIHERLNPDIRELIREKHNHHASIFKNARTKISTIMKNTPLHLIIEDRQYQPINIREIDALKNLFN